MTSVDGFKVEVSSNEIIENFTKWLGHHKTALEQLDGNRIKLIGVGGDTSEVVQKHRVQVRLLEWMVKHVPANVTYRLTIQEAEGLYLLRDLTDPDVA